MRIFEEQENGHRMPVSKKSLYSSVINRRTITADSAKNNDAAIHTQL